MLELAYMEVSIAARLHFGTALAGYAAAVEST